MVFSLIVILLIMAYMVVDEWRSIPKEKAKEAAELDAADAAIEEFFQHQLDEGQRRYDKLEEETRNAMGKLNRMFTLRALLTHYSMLEGYIIANEKERVILAHYGTRSAEYLTRIWKKPGYRGYQAKALLYIHADQTGWAIDWAELKTYFLISST